MEDSTVIIIIVSIIVLIFGGIGVYYLLRFLRGSIKVSLPVTSFNPGDTIKGSFELTAKKPITGKRLVVYLIGTRHERRRNKDGNSQSQSHEFYRQEVVIEDAREYSAGHVETYTFEIPIPSSNPEYAGANQMLQNLATAANFLTDRRVTIRWRVEARLEAKGIDLAGSHKVSLNTSML